MYGKFIPWKNTALLLLDDKCCTMKKTPYKLHSTNAKVHLPDHFNGDKLYDTSAASPHALTTLKKRVNGGEMSHHFQKV